MFVIVPFDNRKLLNSNDYVSRVDITRRFPVDCISIELLTFPPSERCPRVHTSSRKYSSSTRLLHEPFINSNVGPANNSGVRVSILSRFNTNAEKSRGSSSVDPPVNALSDLDPSLDLPDDLNVFSFGALVDSGSFPTLLLLDPQFYPAE
ncbi:hypothetical protein Tco_0070135, partial [Tanacetum coccineum]